MHWLISSRPRHQLPRFAPQKELAERQVLAHQVYDGQACSSVLKFAPCTEYRGTLDFVGIHWEHRILVGGVVAMQNTKPRTLKPTSRLVRDDWELM